jgi:hypothetical protein
MSLPYVLAATPPTRAQCGAQPNPAATAPPDPFLDETLTVSLPRNF